ncbi:MAG: hypothetical protein V2A76_08885 [Planctomycetota bacterium]
MAAKKVLAFEQLPRIGEGDFRAFEPHKWRDPEYNAERLLLKRKLAVIGEALRAHLKRAGEELTLRTSIHNPYVFNGNKVDSLWLYLAPSDRAKQPLCDLLGVEFSADTDASYVHANLVLAVEFEGVKLGLRVHERAWWDTQNLKSICSSRDGAERFAGLLNGVEGEYALTLHDWKKEYRCAQIRWDDLLNYFRYFEPGTHRIHVSRRVPKGDLRLEEEGFYAQVAREFESLLPIYRFILWTPENNHLGMKKK